MRNASLEGLRGIAALLVVLYHLHYAVPELPGVRNGYLAVDLFFVLSGYVIGGAYGASLSDGAAWFAFMARRFGRIWPVHIVASALVFVLLPATALLHGGNISPYVPTIGEVFAVAFLVQGLNLFAYNIGTLVSWSASDEFFAYVIFGLLCLKTRGRARVAAFAALATSGYALAVWASVGPHACIRGGDCFAMTFDYGWARCLVGFFAGALIAEYRNVALVAAFTGRVAQVATFAVALLFVLFADRVPGFALAAPVVFAALIASLSGDSGPVARLFRTRAAQCLGRLSYSLYLAHAVFWRHALAIAEAMPGTIAHVVAAAFFLFASFALAHFLCKYVETPCRLRINAWADTAFRRAPVSTSTA